MRCEGGGVEKSVPRITHWHHEACRFKPSSKIFYWPFLGGTSFVDLICFCSVLCLLCLCVRLFICALWSPAGKGLTSWLSFVVSTVSLSLSHWYPVSGVVLDCIDSWSLHPYLLCWVMTHSDRERRMFLSHPHMNNGFFFLLTTKYLILYWKNLKKAPRKSWICWDATWWCHCYTDRFAASRQLFKRAGTVSHMGKNNGNPDLVCEKYMILHSWSFHMKIIKLAFSHN